MVYARFSNPLEFQAFVRRCLWLEAERLGATLLIPGSDLTDDYGLDAVSSSGDAYQIYCPAPYAESHFVTRLKNKIRHTADRLPVSSRAFAGLTGRKLKRLVFVIPVEPPIEAIQYADRLAGRASISVAWQGETWLSLVSERYAELREGVWSARQAEADPRFLLDRAREARKRRDYAQAFDLASQASAEAELRNNPLLQAQALDEMANRLRFELRLEEAESTARKGLALRPRDPLLQSSLLVTLSDTVLRQGRLKEAETYARQAQRLCERYDLRKNMHLALVAEAWSLIERRKYDQAGEALALAEQTANRRQRVWLDETKAELMVRTGQLEEGARRLERLACRFSRAGMHWEAARGFGRVAELFAEAREFAASLRMARRARRQAQLLRNPEVILDTRVAEARILASAGRISEAAKIADAVTAEADEIANPKIGGEAWLLLARCRLEQNRTSEALAQAGIAGERFATAANHYGRVHALILLGAAQREMGRGDLAIRSIEQAEEICVLFGLLPPLPLSVQLNKALTLNLSGRPRDALRVTGAIKRWCKRRNVPLDRSFERFEAEIANRAAILQRFTRALHTKAPLRAVGTPNAHSAADARSAIQSTLIGWMDTWPDFRPPLFDFWGRGNFARMVLIHRAFPNALHLTVEVGTVDEARRACRALLPVVDCLTLLWKGPLLKSLAVAPMQMDYEGPGGWGYAIMAGETWRPTEDAPWDWCPAMAFEADLVPGSVCRFLMGEARPFFESGRLIVLPARLVGCVDSDHGLYESLLTELIKATPVTRFLSHSDSQTMAAVPYFPAVPLRELHSIICEHEDAGNRLRIALRELNGKLRVSGPDLSIGDRQALADEIRSALDVLSARFRRLQERRWRDEQFACSSSDLGMAAEPTPGFGLSASIDAVTGALVGAAEELNIRQNPWYPLWQMELQFGRAWDIWTPPQIEALRSKHRTHASPQGKSEGELPLDPPDEGAVRHWLHPPSGGWVIPTMSVPRVREGQG